MGVARPIGLRMKPAEALPEAFVAMLKTVLVREFESTTSLTPLNTWDLALDLVIFGVTRVVLTCRGAMIMI
jgi:hypothetical protein